MKMEATYLRDGLYAVRPHGQLGTCGWYPVAWTVQYVNASSREDAIRKAHEELAKRFGGRSETLQSATFRRPPPNV